MASSISLLPKATATLGEPSPWNPLIFSNLLSIDSLTSISFPFSSRTKYILSCHSVVVSHPLVFTQHFHAALDSNSSSTSQNFVELKGPLFNGLEETMAELWLSDGDRNPDSKYRIESFEGAKKKKEWKELKVKEGTWNQEWQWLGRNGAERIADNAVRTLRDREWRENLTSRCLLSLTNFFCLLLSLFVSRLSHPFCHHLLSSISSSILLKYFGSSFLGPTWSCSNRWKRSSSRRRKTSY